MAVNINSLFWFSDCLKHLVSHMVSGWSEASSLTTRVFVYFKQLVPLLVSGLSEVLDLTSGFWGQAQHCGGVKPVNAIPNF